MSHRQKKRKNLLNIKHRVTENARSAKKKRSENLAIARSRCNTVINNGDFS